MWLHGFVPCYHSVRWTLHAYSFCLQELKSQQPQLPAAAAALLEQHGWHNMQSASSHTAQAAAGNQQPGNTSSDAGAAGSVPRAEAAAGDATPAAAHAFSVPGITITSFHLQQLQASKQVRPVLQITSHRMLVQPHCSACISHLATAHVVLLAAVIACAIIV